MLDFADIPPLESHSFGVNISLPEDTGHRLNSPHGSLWKGVRKRDEASDQTGAPGEPLHLRCVCLPTL